MTDQQLTPNEQRIARSHFFMGIAFTFAATVPLTLVAEQALLDHAMAEPTLRVCENREHYTIQDGKYPDDGAVTCVIGRGAEIPPMTAILPAEHPRAQTVANLFPERLRKSSIQSRLQELIARFK